MKNEVILWPQTSSKIIVLVAQPIFTDGGPPVTKGLELTLQSHLLLALATVDSLKRFSSNISSFKHLAHRLSEYLKNSGKLCSLNKEAIS